jgi:hypothetical protein
MRSTRIVGSDMTRKETHSGTGEMVLGIVVVGVWFALKLAYREAVREQHGFISWAYLRADLLSLGIIIVVGAAGLWLLRRIRRRSD